jgi:hypothetical protein
MAAAKIACSLVSLMRQRNIEKSEKKIRNYYKYFIAREKCTEKWWEAVSERTII